MKDNRNPVKFITVESEHTDRRIDNFLYCYLKYIPKNKIYCILRKGEVRVNKRRVKPRYKIQLNDRIRIPPLKIINKDCKSYLPTKLSKLINDSKVYEDKYILALNKPSGKAVHSGSGIRIGLIESLRSIYSKYNFLELVHRLDKSTSGVLLIAKKRSVLKSLHNQLKTRTIKKEYWALLHGQWILGNKKVSVPILKDAGNKRKPLSHVSKEGKFAETHFKVEKHFKNTTLVKCFTKTGRTHQIRVHAAFMGHPIIFDDLYGNFLKDKNLNVTTSFFSKRLCLHATAITILHPIYNCKLRIDAPIDRNLQEILNTLDI